MGVLSDLYRAHLTAWARGDMDEALSYMADDIIWYPNRAMRPIVGKDAVRAFVAKFGQGMTNIAFEQTLMIEQGNFLFVEGIERYSKNGKPVVTHYAGVMEWRDGRAVNWRDYFDFKTLDAQLAS